ncbi:MAG: NUDIX domain-containing protein [Bacteroidota bacterium]
MSRKFNIRVYGIFIKDDCVLVSDEFRFGIKMTKFPGGGLEVNEGLVDCLLRECKEEFYQEFKVIDHFYTTDFYITSAFNPKEQLISIYYTIAPIEEIKFKISKVPFDFELIDEAQSFRWIKLSDISSNDFTFPIDKLVGDKLKVF